MATSPTTASSSLSTDKITTENTTTSHTTNTAAEPSNRDRNETIVTSTTEKLVVYKDKRTAIATEQHQQIRETNRQKQQQQQQQHRDTNRQQHKKPEASRQRQPKQEEVQLTEEELLEERQIQRLEDNDIDFAGYKKLTKIGEGTYGEVFRGLCKKTNANVALKRIQLNFSNGGVPPTAMREVALLKEIKHNNIIRLVDLIYFDTTIYLVFDYCDVDLRKYMSDVGREGLTFKHIKSFTHQLLRGLVYCHSHRILHRDLKPQNLLIDQNGKLTIADLGLSRAFSVPMRTYTHQVITLWYRAPEILLGSPHYSTAVDMWSVGCILAEMITLKPLFPGDSQIDELFRIFRLLGTPDEKVWPGVTALPDYHQTFPPWKPIDIREKLAKANENLRMNDLVIDLLKSLLIYDPYERISAKKAEEHPFFYDDLSLLKFD